MAKGLGGLKNVAERDRRQIEQVEEMLGEDPATMGFVKNVFWGNLREELVFPYPETSADERERCDELLAELDAYLEREHPAVLIDQTQEIPRWVIDRLFSLGVMGMIVPKQYGGGGFGITSYNRALERIGRTCGSTAVMVSAHQSIGCGALIFFGTDEQKRRFLPRMATDTLSAFCLSEPNVGSDAGGQETRCERSADGDHFIVNGEKKWATSGALAGLFTVIARQRVRDALTGREKDGITALICTPDMPGVEITSRNRAKCGIRGTWQARIVLRDVRVPKANLLHREGKGLNVALGCLNIGRCTLSAGMVGPAKRAYAQAAKWARYRYQFERPLADFEQVQSKLAMMASLTYAMDAMLYMTTGMVDRGDEDIMLETAACKVFCSEMGWRTIDEAMQVMGGEGYVTENGLERAWRDARINTIVEGANEVMHSFVFAYGAKQLGESLLEIRAAPLRHLGGALRLGLELAGWRRRRPRITRLHPQLAPLAGRLERLVQEISLRTKRAFATHREALITRQMVQARLALAVIWSHAIACSLGRLDVSLRRGAPGEKLEGEKRIVEHLVALAEAEARAHLRELSDHTDQSMRRAADAALRWADTLPDEDYAIPERTPVESARAARVPPEQAHIPQFGAGSLTSEPAAPNASVDNGLLRAVRSPRRKP